VSRIFELQSSVEIVDEMKSSDVDPADSERIDFSGDDRNEMTGVKPEGYDQGGVTETQTLLEYRQVKN
jgi:hypothetical protein